MSEMERNKGKLILVSLDVETYAENTIKSFDKRFYSSKKEQFIEQCTENEDYIVIDGKVYAVEWECRGGDLDELADVSVDFDGNIAFHTYHYNGGAHWTEVVEQGLTSLIK